MFVGVDGAEAYIVGHPLTAEIDLLYQQPFYYRHGVYAQLRRPAEHSERWDKSHQSEEVVAVQVRNEDVVQTVDMHILPPQMELGAFAAVNHKLLASLCKYLRGLVVLLGGACRAASDNM